jgi:leader peptidase (prepilin peptidase)/N-methyltransferase
MGWPAPSPYAVLRVMREGNKAITGQRGDGARRLQALSAIGAWLGWQALLPVLIVASLSGLSNQRCHEAGQPACEGSIIPFGPFLVAGAMVVAITGSRGPCGRPERPTS